MSLPLLTGILPPAFPFIFKFSVANPLLEIIKSKRVYKAVQQNLLKRQFSAISWNKYNVVNVLAAGFQRVRRTMTIEEVEEQIERCRRIASVMTDDDIRHSLEDLAEEYEAKLPRKRRSFMLGGSPPSSGA